MDAKRIENVSDTERHDPILIIANKIPRESPSQIKDLHKSIVNIFAIRADLKFTITKTFNSKETKKRSIFLNRVEKNGKRQDTLGKEVGSLPKLK